MHGFWHSTRVDAAGGRLLVRSDAAGTLVTAELPCA